MPTDGIRAQDLDRERTDGIDAPARTERTRRGRVLGDAMERGTDRVARVERRVVVPPLRERERKIVESIVDNCMPKLVLPGLVTTTTEEVVWIADWCHRKKIPYIVERRHYRTALVGDPICFIKIGWSGLKKRKR